MDGPQIERLLLSVEQMAGAGRQGKRRPDRLAKIDASAYLLWEEQFRLCVAANGWDHATARREARMAMQDDAAKAVRGIPVGDLDQPVQPFTDLLLLYKAIHCNPATTEAAWIQFGKTRQKNDGETLVAWHSRVRYEFSLAYPDVAAEQINTNRDLIRKFVHGIANTEVADKTLMGNYQDNFAVALQLAISAEASLLRPGRRAGHHIGSLNKKAKFDGDCYNCGKYGHRSAECRQPKKEEKGDKPERGRGQERGRGGRGRGRGRSRGGRRGSPSLGKRIAALEQKLDGELFGEEEGSESASGN